jgi:RNA polymerase sigma factor (sigma-70 family)
MRARQEQVELDAVAHVHVPETKPDPEREAMLRERTELMKRTLQALSARQREILVRFYLHEHTAEQICRDMHLTETQFHQLKARAKARFGEVGQNQLSTPRRRRS